MGISPNILAKIFENTHSAVVLHILCLAHFVHRRASAEFANKLMNLAKSDAATEAAFSRQLTFIADSIS